MNHSWMSAIIRRENSVEKMQVFWPWSSLRMSACTVPRTLARVQAAIVVRSAAVGSRPGSAGNAPTVLSVAGLGEEGRVGGAGPVVGMDTAGGGEGRSEPAESA